MEEFIQNLQERVAVAHDKSQHLRIVGGGSKPMLGRTPTEFMNAERVDTQELAGILSYEPSELVLTAYSGTPLRDIENALAENDQMLAFEPPHMGGAATIGGTMACGLSGPRRVSDGSARDFILGLNIINGHGELLRFGGQVMKNVAGYDVSRLMVGAYGTLGLITQVSLKVLPMPVCELTLKCEIDIEGALQKMTQFGGLPVSASCYDGEALFVRLSGAKGAVESVHKAISGEALEVDQAVVFWQQVRDQELAFFESTLELPFWRISLPLNTPQLSVEGLQCIEWHGALRWLYSDMPAEELRQVVSDHGGHAQLYRGGDRSSDIFSPLDSGILKLHERLKHSFDPQGVFNPGRLYPQI